MSMFSQSDPDEESQSDDYGDVEAMANRLGLEGEGRTNYIDDHMKQLGYVPVQTRESYMKPTPPEEQQQEQAGAGSRWGFGRKQAGPPPAAGGRVPPGPTGQRGDDGDRF